MYGWVIRSRRGCVEVVVQVVRRSFRESTASATSGTVLGVASDESDGSHAVGGEITELSLAMCANAACGL